MLLSRAEWASASPSAGPSSRRMAGRSPPAIATIGLPPVLTGPVEITKFLGFLHGTLYPNFAFSNIKLLIETPDQVFAEYQINHKSGISAKFVNQQFFGHLETQSGKIRRLREA